MISGVGWVPCKGGRWGGDRRERGEGRVGRRRRWRRGRGVHTFAPPFGGRGLCSASRGSAGTCVSVLSRGPCVRSSIFTRPETAAVWIGILHACLLTIKFPYLFGCWDSRQYVGVPRSLQSHCPHLLSSLRPCVLIGQKAFPIREWALGSPRSLEHGHEMRLH